MEILQTIWTALTTPNERLINIISIPLTFLDVYIGMIFFSACLNIKSSRKTKYTICMCVFYISYFIKSFSTTLAFNIFAHGSMANTCNFNI